MARKFHTYDIMQEICKEYHLKIRIVAGSTGNHSTFEINKAGFQRPPALFSVRPALYGYCQDSKVVLDITIRERAEFDLHDPNSISNIIFYIKDWFNDNSRS